MEIYPVAQSHMDSKYARPLGDRSIAVRYIRPDLVRAWADRDEAMVGEIRDDVITDLDSDSAARSFAWPCRRGLVGRVVEERHGRGGRS
ncbi:hypothetical protein BCL76_12330 [Streptomyces sp. CG 926]|nr:hypothetical protein BCL76_12330 [Streptomyces sp. CG 926]